MLYDTVALTIPIKHVHAPGQCNKDMSSLLRRHKVSNASAEEYGAIDEQMVDEMDSIGGASDFTDPRWDASRDFRRPEAAMITLETLRHQQYTLNKKHITHKQIKQQWHILNESNQRHVPPSVVPTIRL